MIDAGPMAGTIVSPLLEMAQLDDEFDTVLAMLDIKAGKLSPFLYVSPESPLREISGKVR